MKRETKIHNCFLLKSQGTFVRLNGSISMTGLKIGVFGSEARSKTRGGEGWKDPPSFATEEATAD